MKTQKLFLYGMIPLIAGILYNSSLMIPVFGSILFMLVPWAMVLVWLWLGFHCGSLNLKGWKSILFCNSLVFVMLLCSILQFGILSTSNRIPIIYSLAQMLAGLVPGVMAFVTPMVTVDNVVSGTSLVLWSSLLTGIVLVLLFALGFWLGNRNVKSKST